MPALGNTEVNKRNTFATFPEFLVRVDGWGKMEEIKLINK